MAWFALDDGFDTHPKVRKAGNAAIGLFVRLGVHATKHLTEGHLDGTIVRDYGTAATIRKLLTVGMLHEPGHGCPRCPQPAADGFYIHDYLDYNKSRAQIEAAREAARKRQQRGRDTSRRMRNGSDSDANLRSNSRQNDDSFASNRSQNAPQFEDGTAGHKGASRRDTHEGATGVPSPPLPSHNYDVADVGEGSTRSRAADLDAYAPSPIDDDGWALNDGLRSWTLRTFGPGIDPDYEAAQFLSHFRSTGQTRRNWNDEYQKWVRRSAKYASERANRPTNVLALPGHPQARRSTTDDRVAAGLALAAELRALEEGNTA